jgi:hypothetical protein
MTRLRLTSARRANDEWRGAEGNGSHCQRAHEVIAEVMDKVGLTVAPVCARVFRVR